MANTGTVQLHRVIQAPPERVYRAFFDTDAKSKWLPPHGFTGKVDKIEFLGGTNIQVVDYKTMQPKSRNEILGQTKSSTGDIYRQLAFYKVLIEECEKERFTVASVMIDFIEPNDKGIYKREVFEVTAGDQASVRETLEKVAGEIVSGEFLGKGCGKPDCPGCRLSAMMK
jgi:hypothetical protein